MGGGVHGSSLAAQVLPGRAAVTERKLDASALVPSSSAHRRGLQPVLYTQKSSVVCLENSQELEESEAVFVAEGEGIACTLHRCI